MTQLHHLYYFIYPPPEVAAVVAQLPDSLGFSSQQHPAGRAPMPAHRLHMILHPLGCFEGGIPAGVRKAALSVGELVSDDPFDVAFDVVQFRGAAGTEGTLQLAGRGPAMQALRRFQRGLGDLMRRVGFPVDQIRASFSPHITLDYEHLPVARRTVGPISWKVDQFCLVDSLEGQGRHEVLAQWPLRQRQLAFSGW